MREVKSDFLGFFHGSYILYMLPHDPAGSCHWCSFYIHDTEQSRVMILLIVWPNTLCMVRGYKPPTHRLTPRNNPTEQNNNKKKKKKREIQRRTSLSSLKWVRSDDWEVMLMSQQPYFDIFFKNFGNISRQRGCRFSYRGLLALAEACTPFQLMNFSSLDKSNICRGS